MPCSHAGSACRCLYERVIGCTGTPVAMQCAMFLNAFRPPALPQCVGRAAVVESARCTGEECAELELQQRLPVGARALGKDERASTSAAHPQSTAAEIRSVRTEASREHCRIAKIDLTMHCNAMRHTRTIGALWANAEPRSGHRPRARSIFSAARCAITCAHPLLTQTQCCTRETAAAFGPCILLSACGAPTRRNHRWTEHVTFDVSSVHSVSQI